MAWGARQIDSLGGILLRRAPRPYTEITQKDSYKKREYSYNCCIQHAATKHAVRIADGCLANTRPEVGPVSCES